MKDGKRHIPNLGRKNENDGGKFQSHVGFVKKIHEEKDNAGQKA
jgi:hypothetical protein